jgi:hypothetical protein
MRPTLSVPPVFGTANSGNNPQGLGEVLGFSGLVAGGWEFRGSPGLRDLTSPHEKDSPTEATTNKDRNHD